ncbi:peroxidase 5-like [Chenopodium quinoa]|uniref:peroxidase 5-like n=1 Tax=Chenopodium quinoa TaxID=63459 RepID=UPI000B77383F|nr:peroxidase 5-like [Chenopodium quinoa]
MQKYIGFSFVLLLAMSTVCLASNLQVGFYQQTCPSAESTVRNVVNKVVSQNPRLGAALIRMHFHDCFVRGCDASILLDSIPGNQAEKEHPANNPSLQGYEVIDEAKAELEAKCPNTVSCADIIAFAARDSALKLGRINYVVQAGRRDGLVSNINDPTGNIPRPTSNLEQLQENFARKTLSLEEMVTLSGAHSIGVSHCSAFNETHPQYPSLDPRLASVLRERCPNSPATTDPTVPLDFVTPNRLDNIYYKNLQTKRALLTSDQALMTSPTTVQMVRDFSWQGKVWANKFADAMVHMGSIEVLTGAEGQIRRNCRVVNY